MNQRPPLLLAALLVLAPAVHACCDKDLDDPVHAVPVVDASIVPMRGPDGAWVTVLGTLRNTTPRRVSNLVVEAKLENAAGRVVDVLSQPVQGVVIGPNQQVAFRLQGRAAADLATYARVEAQVVSGETRLAPRPAEPEPNPVVSFLVAWAPMLVIVAIWLVVMRKYMGKHSPQHRVAAAAEEQARLLARQLAAIEALAASHASRSPAGEP